MCRCDCGNETEVSESLLTGGSIEILEKRKYRRDNTSGFRGVFRGVTCPWEVLP